MMIRRMRVFFLILSFLTISNTHSQDNLENSIIGEWEFKLDIKDVIKKNTLILLIIVKTHLFV